MTYRSINLLKKSLATSLSSGKNSIVSGLTARNDQYGEKIGEIC